MPQLYLHGLAQGDFELALRGLLGEGAPLSASSIERLRAKWQLEYQAWKNRRLDHLDVVYAWADGLYVKEMSLPEGVNIEKILPEIPMPDENAPRRFLIYPGGVIPRFGVQIVNRRGVRRIVRVDPITGVPRIERLDGQQP